MEVYTNFGILLLVRTGGSRHTGLAALPHRNIHRYKAHYSLDCDNGIENAILMKPQTPEMLLEEKQLREQLYAAVMALPEKQAKRIYARYYLGMRVSEIAAAEGVDPSRVRDSIRRGLKQLTKYF